MNLGIELKYTEEQKLKCQAFAKSSYKQYYKEEYKQQYRDAVIKIYKGKLGEFALYNYLKPYDKKMAEPDTSIIKNPTFDSDLIFAETGITIKTHITKDNTGVSWLFKNNEIPVNSEKILAGLILKDKVYKLLIFEDFIKLEDYLAPPLAKKNFDTHQAIYFNPKKMEVNYNLLYKGV